MPKQICYYYHGFGRTKRSIIRVHKRLLFYYKKLLINLHINHKVIFDYLFKSSYMPV